MVKLKSKNEGSTFLRNVSHPLFLNPEERSIKAELVHLTKSFPLP